MRKTILLIALCALVTYTGCKSEKHEKEAVVKYTVTSPLKVDTTITKQYVCQIRSISHIELRAQEKGYLESIFVDEGQYVHKGQLLFRIMPKLYEAELQKAQAEAKAAEIEMQNTETLANRNVVSKNELAIAKAKYEQARAAVSLAQVHLQFTEIKAPFDGIIDRFQVRLGSLIEEGALLTTLSDNSKMWVYFNVSEAEYLNFKMQTADEKKAQVKLLMANNELFKYPGTVETIEADFNNETGNIPFRATFPNPDKLLRHGETGEIQLDVPFKNALIIPQKATFEVLDKRYVFVLGNDNVVHQRQINVAGEMPDLFLVSGGLKDNERLLLEGIRKVKDNDKIKAEYEEPRKVMANLKLYAE